MIRLLFSVVVFASATFVAAQDNPLDAPPPGQAVRPGNPLAPPALAPPPVDLGKIYVADFIKPGARLVYSSGSSLENDDPNKPASAGVGFMVFEVVAIQDSRVWLSIANYLERPNGLLYAGGSSASVTQMEVIGAGTLWIDPTVLAGFQTDRQLTVVTGPLALNGRNYDTTSLTRITHDSASRQIFDRGTGLLLIQQQGSGPPQRGADPNGFFRKSNSQMQYQTYRVRRLPWADTPAPAWANTVKRIRYQGKQSMSIPNGPPVAVGFDNVVEFTERHDGWSLGTNTITHAGNSPTQSAIACADASISTYWIHPDALQAMNPGVIDQDPTLQTQLAYRVENRPDGRYGVFTETNVGGNYEIVRAYSFNDGGLVYVRLSVRETGMTMELSLIGRE